MRALVTGGSGFVGSAVVRALLRAGAEVVCLVRPTSPIAHLSDPRVRLIEGDLSDPRAIERAMQGCQQVFHVAALYSTRPEDEALLFGVNVGGTANVLQAARHVDVQCVVHTSTIGTIGRPPPGRLATEEDRLLDLSHASAYARSKLDGEKLALDAAGDGLPVVVVNPCAPVGIGDVKPSSTGQRIIDYLRGRPPSFPPGGINFCPIEDIAQGHLLAAQRGRPAQRYILGHAQGNLRREGFYQVMERASGLPRPMEAQERTGSWRQLARATRRLLRKPPASAPPSLQPAALTADPSLAIRELGLPQTSLDAAFRQAVEWFREHGYV